MKLLKILLFGLVGFLSTQSFASSTDKPQTCDIEDDNCFDGKPIIPSEWTTYKHDKFNEEAVRKPASKENDTDAEGGKTYESSDPE
jgi:hypothetical protein